MVARVPGVSGLGPRGKSDLRGTPLRDQNTERPNRGRKRDRGRLPVVLNRVWEEGRTLDPLPDVRSVVWKSPEVTWTLVGSRETESPQTRRTDLKPLEGRVQECSGTFDHIRVPKDVCLEMHSNVLESDRLFRSGDSVSRLSSSSFVQPWSFCKGLVRSRPTENYTFVQNRCL